MVLKKNSTKIILGAILLLAFFLRAYEFKNFYQYSHDQDLASWIIKDILVNKHLRLIGQETSSQGVFIGALFYYLQIPFYLIGRMNPLPAVFLSNILGVFATYSVYFVVNKIFNTKTALISALIYAGSALVVFTDREVTPTMPVMLWTVWYLYSLFLVYKGKQFSGFCLWGLLIGLIWHLNLALIILSPLIIVAFLYSKKKLSWKAFVFGILFLLLVNSPLLFFEYRHGFSQTKSIVLSLTSNKDLVEGTAKGLPKLDRVMQLVNKNSISIFSKYTFVKPSYVFWGLVVLFIFLIKKKKINTFLAILFFYWQGVYIMFFSLISLNVSEYYLNGMNIVWIIIASVGLSYLLERKNGKRMFLFLFSLFLLANISKILSYNTDKKGYIEKMALVKEIKKDSLAHNYPCISISYITKPGYDLGYRYLYWLEGMHVNNPISNSPVYTIVFPHELVNKIDKSFGSLGLIYPDYERYNMKDIISSCSGANSNVTDPMFGYVE